MPALLELAQAAAIVARLDDDAFEIAFPARFTAAMKLLRILPYRLCFPIIRRLQQ